MTLKASFLFALLLPAFKLPVVGLKSGSHVAVDAIGTRPKLNNFMVHESVVVFVSNSIPIEFLLSYINYQSLIINNTHIQLQQDDGWWIPSSVT